ncbi:phosphatase PAP2 family protein [Dactylosporangium sp. CA-139066]|uniref:phosphatase PAP2 family protein n=1 Tax=Dactylosporangium sp. CA-139066 TaxID=3239930 RepID=UPI003D8E89E8
MASYGDSFPSGHTTSSTLAAGAAIAVGLTLLRGPRARRALVVVGVAWPVLVGLSRVLLVAHWPTDVLAGWLLGATVVLGLSPLIRRKDHTIAPADPAPGGRRRGAWRLRRPGGQTGGGPEPTSERRAELTAGRRGEPVAERRRKLAAAAA